MTDTTSLFESTLHVGRALDDDTCTALIEHIYWLDSNIHEVRRSNLDPAKLYVRIGHHGNENSGSLFRLIDEAAREFLKLYPRAHSRVLFRHGCHDISLADHVSVAERAGYLAVANGALETSGVLSQLIEGVDRALLGFARAWRAKEFHFGSTLSLAAAKRCGVLDNYPHHVYLTAPLKREVDRIKAIRSLPAEEVERFKWRDALTQPGEILSPAICYHYWRRIQDGAARGVPLEVGTAVGRCFRWEMPHRSGYYRLREFRMREIFAAGLPEKVNAAREQALLLLRSLLPALGLSGQIQTACDPFFVDQYAAKRMLQLGSELKLELKVWLPFEQQSIAVASLNDHRDFFTRHCDSDGFAAEKRTSFCLAFGIERLALALLAQHGADPEKWPSEARRWLNE